VHNNTPSANVVPDTSTYTALLNAHTKGGKLDDAVHVHNDTTWFNVITFTALLNAHEVE